MEIKDVEHLAELARIDLPEEEKKQILKDMKGILAYVGQVEALDIGEAKIEEKIYNVWREDKAEPREYSPELITSQFPDSQAGFLKVKKIL